MDAKLDEIITEGRNRKCLKKILDSGRRRGSIQAVAGTDGNLKKSQKEVANVFADFCEQLYMQADRQISEEQAVTNAVAPVTVVEVGEACQLLKRGRTCAEDGLLAEMLKDAGHSMHELIANVFSDLLCDAALLPEEWRISKLIVLFKKGCPEMPGNYRPVAILPVLYKLFAVVLLQRIKGKLDSIQPEEQSGFRPHRSCSDVVHVLRQVSEKSQDWGLTVWMASLDLEKAFDKVYHAEVMAALRDAGIDASIVAWLRALYLDQKAYVQIGACRSRLFEITRGVRQGDPLSPVPFINVTRRLMAGLKDEWEHKSFGSIVEAWGDEVDKLTYTSFADDTALIARSRATPTSMLRRLAQLFAQAGLKLNDSKCVIQTNANFRTPTLKAGDLTIPIVSATEGFKILGTQFTLLGRTSAELQKRISSAWGCFHRIWPLLRRRNSSLRKRLLIFDSDVRAALLWCCDSWNLTSAERRQLQTAERAMLRRFAGPRRRLEEDFVSWVIRSTHAAERELRITGLQPCVETYLRKKWCWAGQIMRMDPFRWTQRVTVWRDSEWWRSQPADNLRQRRSGRTHWFRWEDDLSKYSRNQSWSSWQTMARTMTQHEWEMHAESFASALCG